MPRDELILPGDLKTFDVFSRTNPFSSEIIHAQTIEGTTILEMVTSILPDEFYHDTCHVFINGNLIHRKYWSTARPKTNTVVNIKVYPAGGGGGKNPLATILMVAVMVAAFYAAPAIVAGAAGKAAAITAAGAWTTATKMVFGGLLLVGSLLVNAIAPPPRPKLPTLSGTSGSDSPTLGISGTSNRLDLFGVVPKVLGTHRFTPPYAAVPFTELVGNDQYLRLLFTYGFGPLKITEEKIGDTLVSSFTDVEREFRRGFQADQLTSKGNWDASGGVYPTSPTFGDWYTISVAGTMGTVAYVVGDKIYYSGVTDEWADSGWDKNSEEDFVLYPKIVNELPLSLVLNYADGYSTRNTPVNTTEIIVEVVFARGLYEVLTDGTRRATSASWQIQSKLVSEPTVWTDHGVITKTAEFTQALRVGTRLNLGAAGQYNVRVKRTDVEGDQEAPGTVDEMTWAMLRSIEPEDPINFDGLTATSLRIKATDQLNNVVDQWNAVLQSIAPNYDGVSTWVTEPTNNPASLYRMVLQGAANARAVADSRVDISNLETWHDFNESKGFEFNQVRDFTSSVYETLTDITSAGRASPGMIDGKWGVIIDDVQTVPTQHFTPRVVSAFEGTKIFADLPHGLRMRFINKDIDYLSDELIVYADGYSASNATEFVSVETMGITDSDQLFKFGRYYLANMILRPESWVFNVDYEYLVANRGDLVHVSHDVLSVGLGSGRIKSMTLDGSGDVLSIVSDETLTMEFGKSYALIIRTSGDAALSAPIETSVGDNTSVIFTTPIPAASAPIEGDLFSFGEATLETIEGVIQSIAPQQDLTAQLRVVPYDDAIFSSDTEEIPAFSTQITTPSGAFSPAVFNIRSDESVLYFSPDGSFYPVISIELAMQNRSAVDVVGISLRYRLEGDEVAWVRLNYPKEAHTLDIPNVEAGQTYVIQARFETPTGPGPWGSEYTHLAIGPDNPPPAITDAIVKDGYIQWNYPSPPRDFKGFKLKRQPGSGTPNWEQAYDLHSNVITETRYPINLNIPTGVQTILIEPVDVVDLVSGDPAIVVLNLSAHVVKDLQETYSFHTGTTLGFPGQITNGTISTANGDLEADSDGVLYLPSSGSLYLTNSTALYLPVEFKEMTFVGTHTLSSDYLPGIVIPQLSSTSGIWDLEFRISTSSPIYLSSGSSVALYLGTTANDDDPYLPNSYGTTFMPYEYPFPVNQGDLGVQYRYNGKADYTQAIITSFDSVIDIDEVEDTFVGTTISSAGTRLSLTNSYRSGTIRVTDLTLLEDGGTAVTARAADQSTLGPLIKTLDASGSGVTGLVNAVVRGARSS